MVNKVYSFVLRGFNVRVEVRVGCYYSLLLESK